MTASPYSLEEGANVIAKVVASNIKGDSVKSNEGITLTANVITIPDAPINLVEVLEKRSYTQLALSWSAGASDGGSIVIDYRVQIAE